MYSFVCCGDSAGVDKAYMRVCLEVKRKNTKIKKVKLMM